MEDSEDGWREEDGGMAVCVENRDWLSWLSPEGRVGWGAMGAEGGRIGGGCGVLYSNWEFVSVSWKSSRRGNWTYCGEHFFTMFHPYILINAVAHVKCVRPTENQRLSRH